MNQNSPTDDELLTARQVAKRAGIRVAELNRLCEAGQAPQPKLIAGTTRRWRRSDVERWLAERAKPKPEQEQD